MGPYNKSQVDIIVGSDPRTVALASYWKHAVPVMQELHDEVKTVLSAELQDTKAYREMLIKVRNIIFNEFYN